MRRSTCTDVGANDAIRRNLMRPKGDEMAENGNDQLRVRAKRDIVRSVDGVTIPKGRTGTALCVITHGLIAVKWDNNDPFLSMAVPLTAIEKNA